MSKKRTLDKILVVDVEATCWTANPPPGQKSEIIEIGLCVLNVKDRNEALKAGKMSPLPKPVREDKRSILISPKYSKVSPFCTELTTITQGMLKDGMSYYDASKILLREYNSQNITWASYGDYDRKQFQKDSSEKNVRYPFGPRHINVKNLFAHMWGLDKEVGMDKALKILGHELEGTHHRGHDDAWNIAGILSSVLECRQ